jgi:microcystin-dependent protein
MDAEYNAIKVTLDAIEGRLPLIQRDDGNLANQSVTIDQISPSFSMGFTLRGPWVVGTIYNTGDGVLSGTRFYRARIANTATSLNSPVVDSGTWGFLYDLALLAQAVTYSANAAPDGTVGAPGIGFASQVLGFFKQAANVIGVSIAGVQDFLITAAGIVLPADPTLGLHAATKQYVDAQIAAQIAPALAAAIAADIGVVKWFPASGTLPLNHVLCYGQALNRTLPLFTVFGTTYGAGDGSTTFNNIDMRGIVPAGVDNMGGVAAGRLTSESIVGGASTIGNSGGEETHLLIAAELAAHTHGVTDAGHVHPITDPGHAHPYTGSTPTSTPGGGFGAANQAFGQITGTVTTGISVNSATIGITVNPTSVGGAHNNVQPTRVGNWIVRTQ